MSLTEYEQFRIAEREWQHPRSVVQSVASPAAGGGFTVPTSGAVEQFPQVVKFKLVTDGNAADRIVVVKFLDPDGASFAEIASPFTQAASKTTVYTFGPEIQQFGANDAANIGGPLPELQLDVTLSISVAITAVQVGDQISDVRLTFARWPVRPPL